MKRTIVIFNTENANFDLDKFKAKTSNLVSGSLVFSQFNLCPYIIAYISEKGNLDIQNINSGFIDGLKKRTGDFSLIDVDNADDFIAECSKLGHYNTNALF